MAICTETFGVPFWLCTIIFLLAIFLFNTSSFYLCVKVVLKVILGDEISQEKPSFLREEDFKGGRHSLWQGASLRDKQVKTNIFIEGGR